MPQNEATVYAGIVNAEIPNLVFGSSVEEVYKQAVSTLILMGETAELDEQNMQRLSDLIEEGEYVRAFGVLQRGDPEGLVFTEQVQPCMVNEKALESSEKVIRNFVSGLGGD